MWKTVYNFLHFATKYKNITQELSAPYKTSKQFCQMYKRKKKKRNEIF